MIDRCFARVRGCLCLAALIAMCAGCGGSTDGPKRYPVSGTVTFNGQPVPKGFITLEPDSDKGNSGPGGGGEIVGGKYDTKTERGIVGGAYKVRITGTDGKPVTVSGEELPEGQPLFAPYETTVDFPADATVRDFEIPAPK
jgi:hypothetical protein